MAQYNAEPNSDLTIQQAVAMGIGFNVLAADVAITAVITSPKMPTAIEVAYTVTASSAPFSSITAAFTTYADALTKSISRGDFSDYLRLQAYTNGAIYLIPASPYQAAVQNQLSSPPSKLPTAAPFYSPGSPTPSPSATPTASPSETPSLVPVYAAGAPTPIPTFTLPASMPTFAPTNIPAYLYVRQVH